MFCKKCGTKLDENASFCEACGTEIISKKQDTPKSEVIEENIVSLSDNSEVDNKNDDNSMDSLKQTITSENKPKKNKKMLILIVAILVVIAAIIGMNGSSASIVGKWESEAAVVDGDPVPLFNCYIDIKSDGTLYFQLDSSATYTGTWELMEKSDEGTLYRVDLDGSGTGALYEPKEPETIAGDEVYFILTFGGATIGFGK